MNKYFLLDNREKVFFKIPKGWILSTHFMPERKSAEENIQDMLQRALSSPISSPPLKETIKPQGRVALLVDDGTRPTPVHLILPPLLAVIHDLGVPQDQVDIILALGTHARLSQEEIERRLGSEVYRNYRITQHDSRAPDLVPVGVLEGSPVKINALAACADVKIGIGTILPHPCGFGGGPKIVMPGISDFESIMEHHLSHLDHPSSHIGMIEGNPFYEGMAKTARMAGLNCIINCIVDGFEQIIDIVFGDPLEAHKAGVERGGAFYQVPIKEEADLTLISAYPHNHGPQIFKPLIPASHATKEGGTIIMVAHCQGGLPPFFINILEKIRTEARNDLQGFVKECLKERKPVLPEASIDFNMAIFSLFLHTGNISIILVCPDIRKRDIERMGFEAEESLQDAISREAKRRPNATLNIFPAGGVLVPIKS